MRESSDQPAEPANRGVDFKTTQWSVVVAAGGESTAATKLALASLCSAYWYPLYAFVRRSGFAQAEAEDLTQAFFARLLEKHYIDGADRSRGRFRSFLLAAMKHFLANERDRARALKRGGGRLTVPLDSAPAEARYLLEPSHDVTA